MFCVMTASSFPCVLECRQEPVRERGSHLLDELDEVAREGKEVARIPVEVRDVERLLRIVLPRDVEAPRSAKVRDARRGGNAGSRQHRDAPGPLNEVSDALFHLPPRTRLLSLPMECHYTMKSLPRVDSCVAPHTLWPNPLARPRLPP